MSKVSSKNTAKKTNGKTKRTTKTAKKTNTPAVGKLKESEEPADKASYSWKVVNNSQRKYSSTNYKGNGPPRVHSDIDSIQITRLPDGKLIRRLMHMDEFNRNLEEYRTRLSTHSFAMFRYKTSWCPKITQKHDWAQ